MARPEPQPGDFLLVQTPGFFGHFIRVGQLLVGDASRYTHAAVVVDDGRVVEAQSEGAVYGSLKNNIANGAVFSTGKVPLTFEQRRDIVDAAHAMIGTPYGWLDYAAIGLHRFGIRPAFVERYITDSGRMICSQLVDEAYKQAGVHLFSDGRLPQDVTPGDLANVLIEEW